MILSKLLVALGLDATDYQKGLDDTESTTGSKLDSITGKLSSMGDKAKSWGRGLTAGVTVPLAAMGLKAMDMASDLDESMSKVNVVFGESSEAVINFSEDAATALGQSQQEALEAAGTYGNLFVSMGLGQDVAADMSTGLVTLASDLASFNNAMPIEALEALRAGLTGEAEPLKRFGVNINAAAIGTKALELGLADVEVDMIKVQGATLDVEKAQRKWIEAMDEHGESSVEVQEANQTVIELQQKLNEALQGTVEELTPAQKAQAVYALVLEQTTTAQGDFARTSEGMANQTRIAKAQLSDAAATMGQQLLPIGLQVIGWVNKMIGAFQALSPETKKTILIVAAIAAGLGPLLMGLGSLMGIIGPLIGAIGTVGGALGGVAAVISGPVLLAIGAVVGAIALLWMAWENNWFGIRDTLTAVWNDTIKPALDTLIAWLKVAIPEAIEILKGFWTNTLLPAIRAVWNFIQTNLIPLFETLADLAKAVLGVAIEILAGIWENVLKPALEAVWSFIENNILPIFNAIVTIVRDTLGPILDWLKSNIIDPLAGAFGAVGAAIQTVIGWIQDLIGWLEGLSLPSWLVGESPSPFETTLLGIGAAMGELSTVEIPRLKSALDGLDGFGATINTMAGGGRDGGSASVGGDSYVIHNHSAGAAALSMSIIDARRRRRLDRAMGA